MVEIIVGVIFGFSGEHYLVSLMPFHSLADIGILAALSFSLAAYRFYDPQVLWKPVCQNLLFSFRRGLGILNLWSGDACP